MTLNDIGVAITPSACTLTAPLSTNGTLLTPTPLSVNANADAVNQVVPSPVSNLAFITMSARNRRHNRGFAALLRAGNLHPRHCLDGESGAIHYAHRKLGYYRATGRRLRPGRLALLRLTAGDNKIHYISVPTLTDTLQISPNLPACTPVTAGGIDLGCTYTGSGAIVPATAIAVKPRPTT